MLQNLVEKKQSELKQNLKRGLVLVIFSGFFFQVLPGSNIVWWPINTIRDLSDTKTILGKSIYLGSAQNSFNTPPTFNGDGYSYYEYKLSERQTHHFNSPPQEFFNRYPKLGIREDWKITHWTKSPLEEKDEPAFQFARSRGNIEGNEKIVKLLNEPGNYYSYRFYNNNQDYSNGSMYISNVDFYIISPKERLLIIINHNT